MPSDVRQNRTALVFSSKSKFTDIVRLPNFGPPDRNDTARPDQIKVTFGAARHKSRRAHALCPHHTIYMAASCISLRSKIDLDSLRCASAKSARRVGPMRSVWVRSCRLKTLEAAVAPMAAAKGRLAMNSRVRSAGAHQRGRPAA